MGNKLFGSASNVGIVREENQDAVFCAVNPHNNVVAMVCDGLGGYKGGAIASSIVRDLFAKSFEATDFNKLDDKHVEKWFAQTLRQSKIAIGKYVSRFNDHFKETNGGASLEQMASTIVLSLIIGKKIHTFWVGDSRAYLLNDSKETWQITLDHNLFNYLTSIKASSLTFQTHSKELLALTNIVSKEFSGTRDDFGISVHEPKANEHFLLLCSDGFYNFVSPEEFYDLIAPNAKDLNKAAEKLLKIGMEHRSNDNLSVVLVNLPGIIHG
ncbi:PP2C family protein-serine/threonine phosphatase [[Mycoplasma] testudinis]|uniref:PP2C family protein-serine/threonine phosphatase n=1 Tax=[Mycoplasma] testudinis TaxID=33924 RepID=UPI00056033A2|nr:PP2C family serine/threonine-protein phosphatase [[Mycoplasma] testudinis]